MIQIVILNTTLLTLDCVVCLNLDKLRKLVLTKRPQTAKRSKKIEVKESVEPSTSDDVLLDHTTGSQDNSTVDIDMRISSEGCDTFSTVFISKHICEQLTGRTLSILKCTDPNFLGVNVPINLKLTFQLYQSNKAPFKSDRHAGLTQGK